jgi:hypothetical protein
MMDKIFEISITVLGILILVGALTALVSAVIFVVEIIRIWRSPGGEGFITKLATTTPGGVDMSQIWAEQRRQALAQDQQFQQEVSYRGLYFITGHAGTGSEGNSGPDLSGPDMGGGFGGGGFDQGF